MVKMVYDGRSVSDGCQMVQGGYIGKGCQMVKWYRWCMMVEMCQMVVRWCMMVEN
jgi:hypothetical protein